MAQQAPDHHKKAAEHHEKAAHHHQEASKYYETNQHEKAAHHAHLAQGHSQQGLHYGADATKAHVEHHGVAEQITKDGGRVWLLKPSSLR